MTRITRPEQAGTLLAGAWISYRRAFVRSGAVLLLASLIVGTAAALLVSAIPLLARAQLSLVLNSAGTGISADGLALLLGQIALPLALIGVLLTATSQVALVRMLHGAHDGQQVRLGAALLHGARYALPASTALVLTTLTIALLAVGSPLLMVLGALGLLAHLAAKLSGRRLPVPLWWCVAAVIPFGAAAVAAVRCSAAVAVIALEGHGPIRAIKRSTEITARAPWLSAVALTAAFAAYFLLQAGVGLLAYTGIAPSLLSVLSLTAQVLTFAFPVAVITELTRTLRGDEHSAIPLAKAKRAVHMPLVASTVSVALLVGMVQLAPFGQVPAAQATVEMPAGDTGEVPLVFGDEDPPPAETPPPGGEQPPEGGEGGETPPGEGGGDPQNFLFNPVLSVAEGELTAPNAPVTLRVEASTAGGGQVPYTFWINVYAFDSNDERELLTNWYPIQASGGGQDASFQVNSQGVQHPLTAGQHRFVVETEFRAVRTGATQTGPTLNITHTIAEIDATTWVALTGPSAPIYGDESAQLTATVSGDSGRATSGSVTFQPVGNAGAAVTTDVDSQGVATASFSGLSVGSHNFEAVYSWPLAGIVTEPDTITVTVLPYPTALTMSAPPADTQFGQNASFAVTLQSLHGGPPPAGSIELVSSADPTQVLSTLPVATDGFAGGVFHGTLATAALPVGTNSLSARFMPGSGQHSASESDSVTHQVAQVPISVSIASSNGWSLLRGAWTDLTVEFQTAAGAAPIPPGGTVVLMIGDERQEFQLTGNEGMVTTRLTSIEEDQRLSATLTGYATHTSGTATADITLRAAVPTLSLALTDPALPGAAQGFTAYVNGETSVHPMSGRVEVRKNGATTWQSIDVDTDGRATFSLALGLGEHVLEARYRSDRPTEFEDTDTVESTFTIGRIATALAAQTPATPPRVGEPYQLVVEATNDAGAAALAGPEGEMTVERVVAGGGPAVVVASGALANGIATLAITGAVAGDDTLRIHYGGSQTHSSATAELTVPVRLWGSTTSLGALPASVMVGEAVELVATVTSDAPAAIAGVVGGQVEFSLAGQVIGTAAVAASGTARLQTTAPSTGSHEVQARYLGAIGAIATSASQAQLTVTKAATSVQLTVDPETPISRQAVQITARVLVDPASSASVSGAGTITLSGTLLGGLQSQTIGPDGSTTFVVVAPIAEGDVFGVDAAYSGAAQFAASANSAHVRVNAAPVTLAVQAPASVTAGDQATVRVQMSTASGTPVPHGGWLDLYSGSTQLDSQQLSQATGGTVDFTVSTPTQLAIGEHQLTAKLRGAYGYLPATSPATQLAVQGRETEVLLFLNPSGSSPRGTALTATARVDVVWSNDRPTGQVWLRNGDQVLAQTTLTSYDGDRGIATFEVSDLLIGAYDLKAEYLPTGNMNAGAMSAAVHHEITGRAVSLQANFAALTVGNDGAVTVDVTDTNATGGSIPQGEIDISTGGSVVASGYLTPVAAGALTSRATITIPLAVLQGGDQQFTISYRQSDNVHSIASQTVTRPVAKLTPGLSLTAVSLPSSIQWGDELRVRAIVQRSSESGALALPLPSGAVTVKLSDGTVCTPVGIEHRCVPQGPGPVRVIAGLAADTNYLAKDATLDLGTASKRTPALTASASYPGSELETGTRVRLDWQLTGPSVRPQLSGLPQGAVCLGEATGYCEFSYDVSAGGMAQQLRVEYAGDSRWAAATPWQQSLTPAACYAVPIRVEPAGSGTVAIAVSTGGRCTNGDYRDGARIGVRATPTASSDPAARYELDNISGAAASTAVGDLVWLTVGSGTGKISEVIARFVRSAACYPVTLQQIGLGGERVPGTMSIDQQPNCPGQTGWQSVGTSRSGHELSTGAVGWYLGGTKLVARATALGGGEFYAGRVAADNEATLGTAAWQQRMPGSFTVSEATRVQARFGTPCVPVTLRSEGPGTVTLLSTPNCLDTLRADQYTLGSEVRWQATPDAKVFGYVDKTSAGGSLQTAENAVDRALGLATYTMYAAGATNTATLTFNRCHTLTIENQSAADSKLEVTPSNCPVGAAPAASSWRYSNGTEVWAQAELVDTNYRQLRFSSWNLPGAATDPAAAKQNTVPYLQLKMTKSLTLRPSFTSPHECAPLTVGAGMVGVEVRVEPNSPGALKCLNGDLLAGWSPGTLTGQVSTLPLTAETRATSGNPQLGWVVAGGGVGSAASAGTGTRGAKLTHTGGGGRMLTAYACQEVSPYVGITGVDGNPNIALQREGELIKISPEPNCPFNPRAWLVGTELSLTAAADERGYTFGGWGGVAKVSESDPLAASYTVTAEAPTVAVTAAYAVVCHTLTITGKAWRVTAAPAPNCPGAPPGGLDPATNIFTGQYVGGTSVALFGEVPGGNVWQGWRGDLVETGKVKVAVAIMDADKTAEHRYRGKSWDEKAEDFFTEAGNQLAVAAKKTLGGVAYIAGKAIQEVPPFSLVGEAFEVISLVGDVLNMLGVPESITKYFSYPAQSLDWVLSGFNCLASASLSSQSGGSSANLSGVADSNRDAVYGAGGSAFRAIGLDPGDDNENVGKALESLYTTGKSLAYVQKYTGQGESVGKAMDQVDNALEIYGMVTGPQGVGWDGSASDAWDSDMGNHITGCMASATPDFLRDVLPIGNDDFARYDSEYGL